MPRPYGKAVREGRVEVLEGQRVKQLGRGLTPATLRRERI